MSSVTKEQSDKLNTRIEDIDASEVEVPKALYGTGKAVPYVGWFWRRVPFHKRIILGKITKGPTMFVGFMESNKWGYPREVIRPGDDEYDRIIGAVRDVAENPNGDSLKELLHVIQESWVNVKEEIDDASK